MKKALNLTAAFAASCLFVNAQIKKDVVLLGGQVSFYNSNTKNTSTPNEIKVNNGQINIAAGKAIKENTVAGIYGGYGNNKAENFISANTKNSTASTNTSAGVFYRKYKTLGKGFYFLGELHAGYSGNKQVYESNNGSIIQTNTNKQTGGALGLTPGLSYQLFKKMQLEVLMPSFAGLRFGKTKNTDTNGATSTDGNYFQVSSSLNNSLLNSLAVGFRLVL